MSKGHGLPHLAIKDFAEVVTGGTPSTVIKEYWENGKIPWLNSGELNNRYITKSSNYITEAGLKNSNAKMMPLDTVLIALTGATTGVTALLKIEACANQSVIGILPSDNHDPKYLFFYLNSLRQQILDKSWGGAQKHISQGYVKEIEVPLPPFPEQRRIAGILDKADTIRKKRQESIRLTEEFLRSVFLDLFGDPVSNPKGWETATIRDLVSEVKYGTSEKASYEGNFPILRMNNITYEGGWDFSDIKRIDIPEKEVSKYMVQKGDILFNRTNSKELVGKTAVYRRDDPMAYAGYLIRIKPNKQNNSEYIAAYLNSKHGKVTLEGMCKSIVGMANINAQELQDIKILKPPTELQNRYGSIVQSVKRSREMLNAGAEAKETLFNSLVQRAFRGEL